MRLRSSRSINQNSIVESQIASINHTQQALRLEIPPQDILSPGPARIDTSEWGPNSPTIGEDFLQLAMHLQRAARDWPQHGMILQYLRLRQNVIWFHFTSDSVINYIFYEFYL